MLSKSHMEVKGMEINALEPLYVGKSLGKLHFLRASQNLPDCVHLFKSHLNSCELVDVTGLR